MINTFEARLVEKFLIDTNNGFVALCWYNDMVLDRPEFVEYNTAHRWFKKHFTNDYMFLLMTKSIPTMWLPSSSDKYTKFGSYEKSLT
jgi:hypothetical protein